MDPLSERVRLWLKTHSAAEKSFATALQRFFREQADRVADAISEIFPENFSTDQLAMIFQPAVQHEKFLPIIQRNLGAMMIQGAKQELRAAKSHQSHSKDFNANDELVWQFIPQNVKQRILQSLEDSTSQPYWEDIQRGVEADLRAVIQAGIEEGLSTYQIGMNIREHIGGYEARRRAYRISRTETTGALSAGHQAAMESLGSAVTSKKWLAIGDKETRETHEQAHGQTVPVNGSFLIGGHECDYPGQYSLPPEERIHCRCTTISVLREDILAAAENLESDHVLH